MRVCPQSLRTRRRTQAGDMLGGSGWVEGGHVLEGDGACTCGGGCEQILFLNAQPPASDAVLSQHHADKPWGSLAQSHTVD